MKWLCIIFTAWIFNNVLGAGPSPQPSSIVTFNLYEPLTVEEQRIEKCVRALNEVVLTALEYMDSGVEIYDSFIEHTNKTRCMHPALMFSRYKNKINLDLEVNETKLLDSIDRFLESLEGRYLDLRNVMIEGLTDYKSFSKSEINEMEKGTVYINYAEDFPLSLDEFISDARSEIQKGIIEGVKSFLRSKDIDVNRNFIFEGATECQQALTEFKNWVIKFKDGRVEILHKYESLLKEILMLSPINQFGRIYFE